MPNYFSHMQSGCACDVHLVGKSCAAVGSISRQGPRLVDGAHRQAFAGGQRYGLLRKANAIVHHNLQLRELLFEYRQLGAKVLVLLLQTAPFLLGAAPSKRHEKYHEVWGRAATLVPLPWARGYPARLLSPALLWRGVNTVNQGAIVACCLFRLQWAKLGRASELVTCSEKTQLPRVSISEADNGWVSKRF